MFLVDVIRWVRDIYSFPFAPSESQKFVDSRQLLMLMISLLYRTCCLLGHFNRYSSSVGWFNLLYLFGDALQRGLQASLYPGMRSG